jgi:integrase
LTRWLTEVAKSQVRETTWNAYYHATQPLIDHMGAKPLRAVTALDIQGVYTALLTDGRFKPATIRITHNVCRQALDDAVDWGLIPTNPALRTKPPRVPRPTVHPLTPAQAQALLKAADGHLWRVLWYTIALTGCRRGEALGLRWPDINWEHRTITIQRTLAGKAARQQVHEPKTASGRRVVAASRFLMDLLKAHQHQQKLAQLAAGSAWVETGFVFTTRTGRPLDGDNVRRAYKKVLKAAGLPPETRIYDLRHAMATWWLSQGVPVKVVSERLGHASIAITLQLYGHVLPNMQAEAAEQMNRWMLGDASASPRRHHET